MRTKPLVAGMILITAAIILGVTQTSFAQEETPEEPPPTDNNQMLQDKAVMIVLVAAIIGGVTAPIVGYATQQAKDGKTDPFNWRQYSLAVIIVLPSTLALSLAEITALADVEKVSTALGTVALFIAIYLQALGIDYAKSRTKKAMAN